MRKMRFKLYDDDLDKDELQGRLIELVTPIQEALSMNEGLPRTAKMQTSIRDVIKYCHEVHPKLNEKFDSVLLLRTQVPSLARCVAPSGVLLSRLQRGAGRCCDSTARCEH
jgi:hypothetical protein